LLLEGITPLSLTGVVSSLLNYPSYTQYIAGKTTRLYY